MKILGVDPGTNILGYAIIKTVNKELELLDLGVVKMKSADSHHEKLRNIFERMQQIIDRYQPAQMAIEAPFYAKNPQSMLKLGRAQGVAIAAAITKGLEIFEYSPKKIKQAITGNGNASKEQVAAMLGHILEKPFQTKYFDATDALATAICHHYRTGNGNSGLPGQKHYSSWGAFLKENPGRKK